MDKDNRRFCLDLTEEEILKWCLDNGFPKFRAGQISKWLNSGVTDTSRMTNIPCAMRQKLEEDFLLSCVIRPVFLSVSRLRRAARWAVRSAPRPRQASVDLLRLARWRLRCLWRRIISVRR